MVVNKVDRPGARPEWVVNETFDLFDKLGASDEQLDFPVVYASALQRLGDARRQGREERRRGTAGDARCVRCSRRSSRRCPRRRAMSTARCSSRSAPLDYSSYLGRLAHRPHPPRNAWSPGQEVAVLAQNARRRRARQEGEDRAGAGLLGSRAQADRVRQRRRHRDGHRHRRAGDRRRRWPRSTRRRPCRRSWSTSRRCRCTSR